MHAIAGKHLLGESSELTGPMLRRSGGGKLTAQRKKKRARYEWPMPSACSSGQGQKTYDTDGEFFAPSGLVSDVRLPMLLRTKPAKYAQQLGRLSTAGVRLAVSTSSSLTISNELTTSSRLANFLTVVLSSRSLIVMSLGGAMYRIPNVWRQECGSDTSRYEGALAAARTVYTGKSKPTLIAWSAAER